MAYRIFYATHVPGFAKDGFQTFTPAYGVQSVSITTTFNLQQVFELGQIDLYEISEDIPDVEVTIEKALDGKPLIYHLATNGALAATLAGRSTKRPIVALSVYPDDFSSASGTPIAEVQMSGMFPSQIEYEFPVDGFSRESITLVGNHKRWKTSSFTFTPSFLNNDTPSGYIQRRQHVVFNYPTGVVTLDVNSSVDVSTATVLPQDIDGISSSGTNNRDSAGTFGAHVQRIRVSTSLGREPLFELGRKIPYFRYATFPVEVTCDIETIAVRYDNVSATEEGINPDGTNLSNRTIKIYSSDGTYINLGTANKLQSVSYSGGDTGGGNVTLTYSYRNFNSLTVTHPADPSGL